MRYGISISQHGNSKAYSIVRSPRLKLLQVWKSTGAQNSRKGRMDPRGHVPLTLDRKTYRIGLNCNRLVDMLGASLGLLYSDSRHKAQGLVSASACLCIWRLRGVSALSGPSFDSPVALPAPWFIIV